MHCLNREQFEVFLFDEDLLVLDEGLCYIFMGLKVWFCDNPLMTTVFVLIISSFFLNNGKTTKKKHILISLSSYLDLPEKN